MENFYSIINQANLLYGLEMNEDDMIDVGLIAWNKIGNKQHKLYRLRANIDCDTLTVQLPCNCDEIEAVTYDFEDWNYTSNTSINGDYNSSFTEQYIEGRKVYQNPFYVSGKYAKYRRLNDTLQFDKNYGAVNILYKGVELDDDNLPYLTQKEVDAIACYCAYVKKFKEGISTHNQAILAESQLLEQKWLKLCDAARVPSYINQNEINEILDAKTSFNRKIFNKSYKPVK